MITLPELAAEALGSYLAEQLNRRLGSTDARLTKFIPHLSRLALDYIGNTDALYHNLEHTMLVTQVGNEIMAGRARLMPTSASDYAHVIASGPNLTFRFAWGFSGGLASVSLRNAQANKHSIDCRRPQRA